MKSLYFLLGPYAEAEPYGAPPKSVARLDNLNPALIPAGVDLTDPQTDE